MKFRGLLFFFLLAAIASADAQALTGNVSVDYPNSGNISQELNFNVLSETYFQKFSFFAGLKLFRTKSFFPAVGEKIRENDNSAGELGVNYNFLTIGRNRFNLSLSHYFTIDYEKSLHFLYLDEIYDRTNIGVGHNFNDDFSVSALYQKFVNSYKNSIIFDIEKALVKNKYFRTYIGYEHQRDIKTSDSYSFEYEGIRYVLPKGLKNYLDEKNVIFLRTSVAFLNLDAVARAGFSDSKIYGRYFSFGLDLGCGF
ncbi:MAG: hypothetical protein LBB09_03785 [Rickettsiales bacterium]|jgi:hypothetical protein|nr:hypothetical protein [Rickettsiales bacterium]